MEFILNWMVLLASFGGIIVVAFMCWVDLMRKASPSPVAVIDTTSAPVMPEQTADAPMPQASVRLTYFSGFSDDQAQHTQTIRSDQPGYIGSISFNGLGNGVPVRYVKIFWQDGEFCFSNLDYQTPLSMRGEDGVEINVPAGEIVPLQDGCRLILINDWTVECRVAKDGEQ